MCAIVRMRVNSDKSRELTFVDEPVPRSIYNRFAKECLRSMSFLPIDAQDLRQIMVRANLMAQDAPWDDRVPLDIFQAQSIRRHVTHQYLISRAFLIKNAIREIVAEYDAGSSAISIARKFVHSPYFVFRHIIIAKYGSEGKEHLAQLSRGTIAAREVFNERDAREFAECEPYDYESVSVMEKIAKAADDREHAFIELLRECGVTFLTQAELLARAELEGKRPVTPDVLFTSKVSINGERAYWIDFKSYFGAPVPYIVRSAKEQYDRYVSVYGAGFIAYEHGFTAGLPYPAISLRGMRDQIEKNVTPAIL